MAGQFDALDNVGYSNSDSMFAKTLRGLDTDRNSDFIPPLRESMGYVFITRPWFNMSYNNMASYRRLMNAYGSGSENTIGNYLRLLMDPRRSILPINKDIGILDVYSPWMTVLTNQMQTCNGWPDRTMDFKVSEPGRLKETTSVATGTGRQYGSFTLNMEFRSMFGNIIGSIFGLWLDYMGEAHSEEVTPYADAIDQNYKDYDVGIWRIVLDERAKTVTHLAYTVGYPTVDSNGANLNYTKEDAFQTENDTYSVAFQCDGLMYNDPLLPEIFNAVNGALDATFTASTDSAYLGGVDRSYWTKLETQAERKLMVDKRPWINTETRELEFYARKSDYVKTFGE